VHSPRLPCALELARDLLGLSLPRVAICARWHRAERSRRHATRKNGL